MNNNQNKINFLVGFLDKNDNARLTELREKFSEYKEYLDSGILLESDEKITEIKEYKFRLEICREGLLSVFKKAEIVVQNVRMKLRNLNRIQLISQIIVLISGATILSTLQKNFEENYNWLKYIAPSLVLVSSILTIWAKNQSESFLIGNQNLYESTSELISLKNQARYLISEIVIIQKYFNLENAKPIIESANNIARDMSIIIEKQ